MAKMKSATRMALVTGEMSDCMSGAEPGRAASVRSSVCRLPLSLLLVATVEDGVRGLLFEHARVSAPRACTRAAG